MSRWTGALARWAGALSVTIHRENVREMKSTKQTWIGLFEVRPLNADSDVLEGAIGAFVNIVGIAIGQTSFKSIAERSLFECGLKVVASEDVEPLDERIARGSVIQELVVLASELSETCPVLFDEFQAYDQEHEH